MTEPVEVPDLWQASDGRWYPLDERPSPTEAANRDLASAEPKERPQSVLRPILLVPIAVLLLIVGRGMESTLASARSQSTTTAQPRSTGTTGRSNPGGSRDGTNGPGVNQVGVTTTTVAPAAGPGSPSAFPTPSQNVGSGGPGNYRRRTRCLGHHLERILDGVGSGCSGSSWSIRQPNC